LIIDTLTASL
jgi:hypothetical protein